MNIATKLAGGAKTMPNKTAVILADDRQLSYQELDSLANRLASGLRGLGITKGDRVSLFLQNCIEFIVGYYSIVKMGAIVVPMDPMLKRDEIKYILGDAGVCALITDPGHTEMALSVKPELPQLRHIIITGKETPSHVLSYERLLEGSSEAFPVVDCDPADVAVIPYTSGTTGVPKGAMLTHYNVMNKVNIYAQVVKLSDKDSVPITSPLSHLQAQNAIMNAMVFVGGTQIFIGERWDAEKTLKAIDRYKATILLAVPTMISYIENHPDVDKYDLSSLRFTMSGGAPLPVGLAQKYMKRTKAPIVEGYGLTECQTIACGDPYGKVKLGAIGQPCPGVDVKIVDDDDKEVPRNEVGELIVRSPCIMKGYLNNPKATREALRGGWLHTKDLCRMDEEGYIYFYGRKDDMILSGGFNVYPRETENVLYVHPKVAEAAIVGVPDELKGQLAKAYIVLKKGETATEKEIIDYCKEKIAAYKAPRLVEFVDQLPKSSVGKILHRKLREPR